MKRLLRDTSGSDMIEYALLMGVVGCVALAFYPMLSAPISRLMRKVYWIMRRV